jgi:hypothetical protein
MVMDGVTVYVGVLLGVIVHVGVCVGVSEGVGVCDKSGVNDEVGVHVLVLVGVT